MLRKTKITNVFYGSFSAFKRNYFHGLPFLIIGCCLVFISLRLKTTNENIAIGNYLSHGLKDSTKQDIQPIHANKPDLSYQKGWQILHAQGQIARSLPDNCIIWQQEILCRLTTDLKRNKSDKKLIENLFQNSYYPTKKELTLAIKRQIKHNHGPEDPLLIRLPFLAPIKLLDLDKPLVSVPRRAIYLTRHHSPKASQDSFIRPFQKKGINAVVFDVKDVRGLVSIDFRSEKLRKLYRQQHKTIANFDQYLHQLHSKGLYSIARIAIFQDRFLAIQQAHWGLRNLKGQHSKRWLDPSLDQVQEHHLAIIHELALRGVNEIQLDYVRFPSSGEWAGGRFANVNRDASGRPLKHLVITDFIASAKEKLTALPTLLSADTFGITAWNANQDLVTIGQNMPKISLFLDIVSPMLYPSHFNYGFAGKINPADEPYYFLFHGVTKMQNLIGKQKVIRPWLQAFRYRTSQYNGQYILRQIQASNQAGGQGYLLWNASNRYQEYLDIPQHNLDPLHR